MPPMATGRLSGRLTVTFRVSSSAFRLCSVTGGELSSDASRSESFSVVVCGAKCGIVRRLRRGCASISRFISVEGSVRSTDRRMLHRCRAMPEMFVFQRAFRAKTKGSCWLLNCITQLSKTPGESLLPQTFKKSTKIYCCRFASLLQCLLRKFITFYHLRANKIFSQVQLLLSQEKAGRFKPFIYLFTRCFPLHPPIPLLRHVA